MGYKKLESEAQTNVEPIRLRRHNFPSEEVPMQGVPACHATGEQTAEVPDAADNAVRDQKVIEMLPLLHRIAKKMRVHLPANVEVDDLVGAGALGLIDAAKKFDARKSVKFETYAQYRIRGAIIDGLRAMDDAPRNLRDRNKKAETALRELEGRLRRPATDEEFAEAQGISLNAWYRRVHELQMLGVEWFRETDSSDDPHNFIEETVPSPDRDNQFDLCYLREKREILNRALAALPSRERLILVLYYVRQFTMMQIADELNIDESRVSQIHSVALLHLRTTVMTMLRAPRHSTVLADDGQQLEAA